MAGTRLAPADDLNVKPPGSPVFVPFMDAAQIDALLDDAKIAREAIGNMIAKAKRRSDAIDRRLRADLIEEQERTIRKETDTAAADTAKELRDIAYRADAQRQFWTRRAVMLRLPAQPNPVASAQMKAALCVMLERTDSVELPEIAEFAAASNDRVMLDLLRREMMRRPEERKRLGGRIDELWHAVPMPELRTLEVIDEIQETFNEGWNALQESKTGKTNPAYKINRGLRERQRAAS